MTQDQAPRLSDDILKKIGHGLRQAFTPVGVLPLPEKMQALLRQLEDKERAG